MTISFKVGNDYYPESGKRGRPRTEESELIYQALLKSLNLKRVIEIEGATCAEDVRTYETLARSHRGALAREIGSAVTVHARKLVGGKGIAVAVHRLGAHPSRFSQQGFPSEY